MDLEELYVDVPTTGKTGAEGKNSDGANTGEWHKRYPGFKPVVEYVGNFSASQSGMTPRKVGLGGCLNLGFIHSFIHSDFPLVPRSDAEKTAQGGHSEAHGDLRGQGRRFDCHRPGL